MNPLAIHTMRLERHQDGGFAQDYHGPSTCTNLASNRRDLFTLSPHLLSVITQQGGSNIASACIDPNALTDRNEIMHNG
jgi:hypothetical protein